MTQLAEMTLYRISDDMAQILQSEEWTDENEAALGSLNLALEAKVSNITHFMDDLNAFTERCKAEEKRIAERRKATENRSSSLKAYLTRCMIEAQRTEIEVGTRKVSLQKNPPAMVIDNEADIPPLYFDVIPQTTQLNKALLKEALKLGTVTGAHLESGLSLRVR